MSTIGPAGFAAQIASSVAQTKRGDAHRAREAESAESHRMKTESDPARRAENVDNVDEAKLDSDRDPDGRHPWEFRAPKPSPDDRDSDRERRRNDSLDFLGGELDLEA